MSSPFFFVTACACAKKVALYRACDATYYGTVCISGTKKIVSEMHTVVGCVACSVQCHLVLVFNTGTVACTMIIFDIVDKHHDILLII